MRLRLTRVSFPSERTDILRRAPGRNHAPRPRTHGSSGDSRLASCRLHQAADRGGRLEGRRPRRQDERHPRRSRNRRGGRRGEIRRRQCSPVATRRAAHRGRDGRPGRVRDSRSHLEASLRAARQCPARDASDRRGKRSERRPRGRAPRRRSRPTSYCRQRAGIAANVAPSRDRRSTQHRPCQGRRRGRRAGRREMPSPRSSKR